MKISEIKTSELERILKANEQVLNKDSFEVRAIQAELNRRTALIEKQAGDGNGK